MKAKLESSLSKVRRRWYGRGSTAAAAHARVWGRIAGDQVFATRVSTCTTPPMLKPLDRRRVLGAPRAQVENPGALRCPPLRHSKLARPVHALRASARPVQLPPRELRCALDERGTQRAFSSRLHKIPVEKNVCQRASNQLGAERTRASQRRLGLSIAARGRDITA